MKISIAGNLDTCLQREWLETNGLGGFASSTIAGLNTRRYHGLLVAALTPPAGRFVLLSKLEETLIIDGKRYDLSSNRYIAAIHPEGYRYLSEFRLDPFPVFLYNVNGLVIEKRVFMVDGENTTVIEYEIQSATEAPHCTLEVRPLIAFRDYHCTTRRNGALNASVESDRGLAMVTPYDGLPALHIAHNAAELEKAGFWYNNFEYSVEQERGLDFIEDLFNPFVLKFQFDAGATASLIASTESRDSAQAVVFRRSEIQRRTAVAAASPSTEPLVEALVRAADQFLVTRGNLKTVLAGYHWFSAWGRDTMIALTGLTLVTGRSDVAREILSAFANSIDQGMLPNRFLDSGEIPEYNTVDATLWFFEAIRSLVHYTGDLPFVRKELYDKLKDIIEWHLRGTRYGIRVDADGLLNSGAPGLQLTWMDSKIGDWVVTPRCGKPVEIQALWYNAVRIMEDLAGRFEDAASETFFAELAVHARENFHRLFWNEEEACLYDCVNADFKDGSIRPNQIFAVSLPHALLSGERARSVVSLVGRELRTPFGLRSLSPRDPQYHPRYEGGVRERDSAYHQGTVWPWLLGPFITAYMKVNEGSDVARTQAASWLTAFDDHMRTAGLGHISEIADGEAPHHPHGCIAQAWNVAELLRAAVEDVF